MTVLRRMGSRSMPSFCAVTVLMCLVLSGAGSAVGEGPPLSVIYDPPRLSVDASGVTLPELLREIGAKAGFAVVETAAPSDAISISLSNASLDEVLGQLLRSQNHILLYRGAGREDATSGGLIDEVVLFGALGEGGESVSPAAAPQVEKHLDESSGRELASEPRQARDEVAARDVAESGPEEESSVEERLMIHALHGLEGWTGGMMSRSSTPPQSDIPDVGEALAIATRRAQQAVTALVEGLAVATSSLHDSLATR